MTRHVVVHHGYNEQLFPDRAHPRPLLSDNRIVLDSLCGQLKARAIRVIDASVNRRESRARRA